MRSLSQESNKLPCTSINITSGAKPTKRWSSSDESIVGIEPGTGAAVIVAMFKQFIE